MADTKISNLTGLAAAPNEDDVFALVDTSASSTKKLEARYLVRDSGGSGAIVTGAYTLTLQQSMQAAGRNVANTFTTANTFAEIVTASKGIAFPVTPVASDDAHTLDDYEEGTWTPSAEPSVGSLTSATAGGTYTKVGNKVTVVGYVDVTDNSTGSGYLSISSLPFVAGAANSHYPGAGWESSATGKPLNCALYTSLAIIIVMKPDGTYPLGTGYRAVFSCTYFV